MTSDRTTEASKTELTDEVLDGAVGATATFKFFRPSPENGGDTENASTATRRQPR